MVIYDHAALLRITMSKRNSETRGRNLTYAQLASVDSASAVQKLDVVMVGRASDFVSTQIRISYV